MLRSGIQLAILPFRFSFKGEQPERAPWSLHRTESIDLIETLLLRNYEKLACIFGYKK
jgi:hypothetical protein